MLQIYNTKLFRLNSILIYLEWEGDKTVLLKIGTWNLI